MEFDVRTILIIIGVVVIGLIFIDGFRRMRRAHQDSIRMRLDIGGKVEDDVDLYCGELPGGGARPATHHHVEPDIGDEDLYDPIFAPKNADLSSSRDFVAAEEEIDVPMEESFSAVDDDPNVGEQGELFAEEAENKVVPAVTVQQPEEPPKPKVRTTQAPKPKPRFNSSRRERRAEPEPDMGIQAKPVEELIIFNLMAKPGTVIKGDVLLEAVLACNMRFGRMNIFHRHEKANGDGDELFGMANVLEPGTFDIHNMDKLETKGVCLFLSLPGPEDAIHAFDLMVDALKILVERIRCDVKDGNHSALTQQTLEHYRQRVLEFQRKQMSKNAMHS